MRAAWLPATAPQLLAGDLRRHVLCFLNDDNLDWLDGDPELRNGDRVTVLQSVSGG